MLAAAVALTLSVAQAVPHHGAYIDLKHYKDSKSFAGMRFIAEGGHSPKHKLTMVGTDDGETWFTLLGSCSGKGMQDISFDFSPKGGPEKLDGVASTQEDGKAIITWPDGNVWHRVETPPKENVRPF